MYAPRILALVLAIWGLVMTSSARAQAPYHLKDYRVGMKGGGGHYSQWMIFDLRVYPDGTITAPINMENDVFGEAFCGTFKLELHDQRDNALLFSEESPGYCIGSKPPGHAVNEGPVDWTTHTTPEIANRFMAHPSVYGVKAKYDADNWLAKGVLIVAKLVEGRLVPDAK